MLAVSSEASLEYVRAPSVLTATFTVTIVVSPLLSLMVRQSVMLANIGFKLRRG